MLDQKKGNNMNENEIREIVKEEINKVLFVIPSVERGIYADFVNEEYKNINLNEGLYKTYPPETTIRYIKKLFDFDERCIRIIGNSNSLPEEKRIQMIYFKGYGNTEKMKNAMMLCGYVLSKSQDRGNCYVEEVYIPINLPNIDSVVRKYNYITHVTPLYNKKNILLKGFVPKSKNEMFSYPDRIFFFKGDTHYKEILYQCMDFDAHLKNRLNRHIYTIFIVDTKKIPENVHFHTDLTYPFGIYTSDNIPPSAIKSYQDFNVEEFKNKYF